MRIILTFNQNVCLFPPHEQCLITSDNHHLSEPIPLPSAFRYRVLSGGQRNPSPASIAA